MEEVVLEEMRRLVGYPGGKGDGTFCPGGSISNGFGISCARYSLFPEVKVDVDTSYFLKVIIPKYAVNELF